MAANYLRKEGYELLGANFRCRFGEIDLIGEKDGILTFVEVKLRKDDHFAEALEFVDRRKQERLRTTALFYIQRYELENLQARFDVIEIYAPQGEKTKKPIIHHLEDAFQ